VAPASNGPIGGYIDDVTVNGVTDILEPAPSMLR